MASRIPIIDSCEENNVPWRTHLKIMEFKMPDHEVPAYMKHITLLHLLGAKIYSKLRDLLESNDNHPCNYRKLMDNNAFTDDQGVKVELCEIKKIENVNEVKEAPQKVEHSNCEPNSCKAAKDQFQNIQNSHRANPWSKSKSIFLVVFLVLFVLWIIVFSFLTKYNVI